MKIRGYRRDARSTGRAARRLRHPTGVAAMVVTGLVAASLAVAAPVAAAPLSQASFGFTGGYQSWTVPTGVHFASFSVVGGAGGDGAVVDSTCTADNAGAGGWVEGTVPVTPGQTLSVWVGDGGHLTGAGGTGTPDGLFAGGAGGAAGVGLTVTGGGGNGGGGGAASAVWSTTARGDSALLLVGGGGGAGGGEGPAVYECGGRGGNGGRPAQDGQDGPGSDGLAGGGSASDSSADHSGFPGDTPPPGAFGGGGGGGGAGYGGCGVVCPNVGGGGHVDSMGTGITGGGGGGTSFAASSVTSTFFSSSGAHGDDGSVTITWGAPSATSISSGTADVGTAVSLHAFVEPSDGGGTVRFASDGVTVPDCGAVAFTSGGGQSWEATCLTSALAAGVHEISATFSGDQAYAGSASSGFWTIHQPTTTTVTAPADPVHPGDSVTLDAAVTHANGHGSVGFTDDGTVISGCTAVSLIQSMGAYHATCTTTAPAVGEHTITATFSGDTVADGSHGSTSLAVTERQTVPAAPVIGLAEAGDTTAQIFFNGGVPDGGSRITGFTVLATPVGGGPAVRAAGTSSPITLTGLTNLVTYTATVAAINAVGIGSPSAPSDPFTPVAPINVTTAVLPSATVGTAYSAVLHATGGSGGYSWSVEAGSSLPGGLTLHADGTITGTPTTPATAWQFAVRVQDTTLTGQVALSVVTITIAPAPAADLSARLTHDGTFRSGWFGQYTLRIGNNGARATHGTITAQVHLPAGLVTLAARGDDMRCTVHPHSATCTLRRALHPGGTAKLQVWVWIAAPPGQTLHARASISPTDASPTNNVSTDSVLITPGRLLLAV